MGGESILAQGYDHLLMIAGGVAVSLHHTVLLLSGAGQAAADVARQTKLKLFPLPLPPISIPPPEVSLTSRPKSFPDDCPKCLYSFVVCFALGV